MDPAQATALTNAIQALAAAVTAMPAPPAAPAAHVPVVDLFESNQPFDLSTCSGNDAFNKISNPLDEIWDGTVETFPLF